MTTLDKLTDTVRESLDVLAEGWQDLWHKAKHAIIRFTPASDDEAAGSNRWGLLSAELQETGDLITVAIEAPGMKKEDFELFVNGQVLVVRGTKSSSGSRNEGHFHITERAYGKFERAFTLPADVDESKTTANYKNGVLNIELAKLKAAKPRIIPIG